MNIILTFFINELARLRHNCMRLKRGLDQYAIDDPRSAGQLKLFENELDHYRQVVDLMAHATSPAEALFECRFRYTLAAHQHGRSNPNGTMNSDRWWYTLGQIQYLAYLYNGLKEWLDGHSQDEIRADAQAPSTRIDVLDMTRDLTALRAIATAHDNALGKAYLVRNHVDEQDHA